MFVIQFFVRRRGKNNYLARNRQCKVKIAFSMARARAEARGGAGKDSHYMLLKYLKTHTCQAPELRIFIQTCCVCAGCRMLDVERQREDAFNKNPSEIVM